MVITSNWDAPSGQQWMVPVGGGFGRVFKIGKQPINARLEGYYNVEHPDAGPDWAWGFTVQLLYPKKQSNLNVRKVNEISTTIGYPDLISHLTIRGKIWMNETAALLVRRAGQTVITGLLLGTVSLLLFSSAEAKDGFYLGGGGGAAKYSGLSSFCGDLAGDLGDKYGDEIRGAGYSVAELKRLAGDACDGDNTAVGFKVFGGWRFNDYIGLDGGFANLGEVSDSTTIQGQKLHGQVSVDSLFIEAVGSVPLGERARLLGKLGAANISPSLKLSALGYSISHSDDSTEAIFGAGVEFDFTERLSGRVEWERFDGYGGIDLLSASLVFYPGASTSGTSY
ncbi:MAG: outer membrane beta-barrel protein [Pseudomonadota bacterium]|nr:outer membrane beta-barrel protein [Pseudomonadota bacterium]